MNRRWLLVGMVAGLMGLVAGCASNSPPPAPGQSNATWRIEPISYSTPETVASWWPETQGWTCWGTPTGTRWLVIEARIINLRAQESVLAQDDSIVYEHPSGRRFGDEGRDSASPGDESYFAGSPYEPNPRFGPREAKTGYLFYRVWTELMPQDGEPLQGRLLFMGSKFSDAQGQTEVIDLVGLPPGPPPSGPIQCP